jgi:hypothetical protein
VLALAGCAPACLGTGSDAQQATAMSHSCACKMRPATCGSTPPAGRAGRRFTITMDNRDAGVLRNVAIDTDPRTTRALFRAGWSTASPP